MRAEDVSSLDKFIESILAADASTGDDSYLQDIPTSAASHVWYCLPVEFSIIQKSVVCTARTSLLTLRHLSNFISGG